MTAFESVRSQAIALSREERYRLVSDLLASDEEAPLQEEDEGLAEAERRWQQDKDNPDAWLTHEEFLETVTGKRQK